MRHQSKMLSTWFILAFAVMGCGNQGSQNADNGPEDRELEGVWIVDSANALGETAPKSEAGSMKIEFRKDKAIWHFKSSTGWKTHVGTLWIDVKTSPKQMDLSQPDNPDAVAFCIYKVEGNKLTIKMGIDRPHDFDESSLANLVFIRR